MPQPRYFGGFMLFLVVSHESSMTIDVKGIITHIKIFTQSLTAQTFRMKEKVGVFFINIQL